jgi:hypothetical protein
MKRRAFPILLLAITLAGPAMLSGCSDQQTTTTTVQPADPDAPPGTTSSTTTTTTNEPDSVLGSTLNAVGTIILFPFRLIGDALGLIF